MLYTKKGDDGKMNVFGCDQRISKSSAIAEALGTLDEINSFLGFCKVLAEKENIKLVSNKISDLVHNMQQNLFIVQAELAGSDKTVSTEKVEELEKYIALIEKELPPIKTFFVSGGTDLASRFDFARTLIRRAERRVVSVSEENKIKIGKQTLAYLNRLSSLLYGLARLTNHKSGIKEAAPDYK